jgi:hypothetical protein
LTIYIECNPDEVLVRLLTGLPRRQIVHEYKGKAEVLKRLSGQTERRALVDEDPNSVVPPYLQRMSVTSNRPSLGLRVYDDPAKDNRVIVLRPKLEDWILAAARDADIDARDYGLYDNPERLHRHINANIDKFERMLSALANKKSPRLRALGKLLR